MKKLLQSSLSFAICNFFAYSSELDVNSTAVNSWILLQGFDWASISSRGTLYTKISSGASSISAGKFDAVWFPPPSQSVDAQGYMPEQWYLLESESNLKSAISAVKSYGMQAIADVVVNHRAANNVDSCTGKYTSFLNPVMGNWAVTKDDENCKDKTTCGCGNYDTGDVVTYCPDLDHTNTQVQSMIKDYLSFLKTTGFSGWRLDMVKGYSASYAGAYITASAPTFSVGEYWDSSANAVSAWIDGTGGKSNAFDFPLRYTLQSAIQGNNYASMGWMLPGVIGKNPSHSVTFLDNHDTNNFGTSDQIKMGYAYILTHPGTPCVFWNHWNDAGINSVIKTLNILRKNKGITSTASVYIEKYQSGLYAAYINNAIAVKLGTNSWSPSDTTYKLYTSGNNFAVWAI